MIDLRKRLSELDQLEAPDMRADIERRAARLLAESDEPIVEADRAPLRWRGPLTAMGTAAAILVVVAAAALMLRTDPGRVTDEPAPSTTVVETSDEPIDVDSLTWSRVQLDPAVFSAPNSRYQLEVSDIIVGGPGLVAVGGAGPGGETKHATVWTSPDGYTWTRVPYDEATFGTDLSINAVTVGGPGLVAVGGVDVWLSPDGYTWNRIPRDPAVFHPITGDLRGVIAGGPGLVAFGESAGTSAVWTSPDGYTWTQVPHDEEVFGRSSTHSMIVGGPGLVAVGVDETGWPSTVFPVVWASPDGYTWTRVPHDPSVFTEETSMVDVAAGGSGLVAVGADGRLSAAVWTSPDGFTWARVPHDEEVFGGPYEDMSSVAAFGDGFIAVGSWPWINVWTSPDGFSWTRISAGPGSGPDDGTRDDPVFGEGSMHKVITDGPGVVVLGGDGGGPALWVASPTGADDPHP